MEPRVGVISLAPSQRIGSRSVGGGELMLADVQEGCVTIARARDVYGVVLSGDPEKFETLAVDEPATVARRASLQQ
jgi:hypothetical protein